MAVALRRPVLSRIRSQRRFLSSTVPAHDNHHSYFRRDSELVYFPDGSKFGPQPNAARRPRPARPMPAPEASAPAPAPHQGGERNSNNLANWTVFFAGFLAFPLLYTVLKASNWAFGTEASTEASADISRARSSSNEKQVDNLLQRILDRANEETKTLHLVIHRLLRPDEGLHGITDDKTLEAHPIKMSNGTTLENGKARLARIVNKEGKTLVLLLAVDMTGHTSTMQRPGLAWSHDDALRSWMESRAAEISNVGQQADPEQGILLFCYTASSSGTYLPRLLHKQATWQECRLPPGDMPPGFPLNAFDGIQAQHKSDK